MKGTSTVSVAVGKGEITFNTGVLARQASGSVTVRTADTILFSAVTAAKSQREGIDYFPLQVEYREKFYASGQFPGGFFKRESRPSEKEILTARITDRPIRPLFPDGYRNEVQIVNILLSADRENDPDVLSVLAASAALTLSDIPFMGPIAGVRVGRVDGQFVVNPTHEERDRSDMDLIYCSTRDLPLMIEGEAKEIQEEDLLAAMRLAHGTTVKLIDAQLELRRLAGLPDKVVVAPVEDTTWLDAARELAGRDLESALTIAGKADREARVSEIKKTLKEKLAAQRPDMTEEAFRSAFDKLETEVVRTNVLARNRRVDGRGSDDLRPLGAQVGVLPRPHGSALFNRGETQALAIVTLGTKSDVQNVDAIAGGEESKKFMLHYNFPHFSVGETGRIGATGRREIGHGALAERSLYPMLPENYPYTVRVVAEIMGSNGSSSMASVCAGSLALMDTGVPMRKPVAGISIGLFSNKNKAVLVTDIIGTEDHCGDMDFKVAGTRDGVTGFQVDLKIPGLDWTLVEGAFAKARAARLKILDFMSGVLAEPRSELSPHAPRIHTLQIPVDKIGELIGPGGKNIRRITELSGAQIDIEEDGTVNIFATNGESMAIAEREVGMITAEAEVGRVYEGVVTGVKEFGAFVEILPGKDGLVHISEMAEQRIRSVDEVCKVGDTMLVKCIGVDERGRVKLSRKEAMRERDA